MRLVDFVAQYPTARLATSADNDRILEFFERTPMRTSAFEVQYRRRPDFFQLLRYQSDRFFVIVSEDRAGAIRSVGTVSLRPGWMNGRPTTIGYLGDLRIAFDRGLVRAWRRFFTDLLTRARDIEELADCTAWFTAVLDGNRAALAALRSQGREQRQPTLLPIGPFTMRNILARLPLGRRPAGRWQARRACAADREALIAFFEHENQRAPFGFRDELVRRMGCWDGLSIDDFVLAADEAGLVACVAPWSPSAAKQTVVSRVPAALRILGLGARALPTRPLRVPEPGETLRAPCLTHLTFASRLTADERPDVFRGMLDLLFDRWRDANWHCVSLCDFHAWNLGRALGGFVQQTVPITVYTVVSPAQALEPNTTTAAVPPAFEMALV
jgi:hypothetical protein